MNFLNAREDIFIKKALAQPDNLKPPYVNTCLFDIKASLFYTFLGKRGILVIQIELLLALNPQTEIK